MPAFLGIDLDLTARIIASEQACTSNDDCQSSYCANSRCAGNESDHCGEIGGTVYPNLCVPTRSDNQGNDQPNEVYAEQVYRNLAHGDQFIDSLGMSDQDVYKFEFQGDASISTTITVTPTQAQQGDTWFPVTCYLMEPDQQAVLTSGSLPRRKVRG